LNILPNIARDGLGTLLPFTIQFDGLHFGKAMISGITSTAAYGMNQAASQMNQAAQKVANPHQSMDNYTQSRVHQSVAQATYGANGAVIRTADEMVGTLLDIVA